jgi:hypothetical protein
VQVKQLFEHSFIFKILFLHLHENSVRKKPSIQTHKLFINVRLMEILHERQLVSENVQVKQFYEHSLNFKN